MSFRSVKLGLILAISWGLVSIASFAFAQGLFTGQGGPAPAVVPESAQGLDPSAIAGPTLYLVDSNGQLDTFNLGTLAAHVVGSTGLILTDIAFDSTNNKLYGLSFTQFFTVDTKTAKARLVGSLGVTDANALVFDSAGNAYSAGVSTGRLYKIDVQTGRASVIGRTGGFSSAGDLTFYNDKLVMSAYRGAGTITTTTKIELVDVNPKTGTIEGNPVALPIKEVFGLVSTGKNELYGTAFDGANSVLYKLVPTATTLSKRAVFVANLTRKGLGQIFGAAYDGNFQP